MIQPQTARVPRASPRAVRRLLRNGVGLAGGVVVLVLGAAAYFALPLVDRLTLRWFSRDLVSRGELVATALSDAIGETIHDPLGLRLQSLFDRAVQNERLVAIGLCSTDGELLRRAGNYPASLGCEEAMAIAARLEYI